MKTNWVYCCILHFNSLSNPFPFTLCPLLKSSFTPLSCQCCILYDTKNKFSATQDVKFSIAFLFQWFLHLKNSTYFFITVSSSRSILFCTKTVGISPTSASTFSLQLLIAWNDSLSVVEKTRTHAWAPGMQDSIPTVCVFKLSMFLKMYWIYSV